MNLTTTVTLFPSECSELFEMLFVGLQKHHISKQNFENKPTLSDLGSAIKKFCADHGMSQNLCHRHLIENIGSNSIFGLWASKILKIKSLRDFLKMKKFYISEITTYHSFLKNFGFNTTTTEKSVKNLLIMLIDPEENISPEIKKVIIILQIEPFGCAELTMLVGAVITVKAVMQTLINH